MLLVGQFSITALVYDHQPSSPAFNGGDIGDVENGDNGDDMPPTKELMYRLKNHPPEKNKMSDGKSPRGSKKHPPEKNKISAE